MMVMFIFLIVLLVSTLLYLRQDKFGKIPAGARLERMKQSPNFKNGKFQNLSKTPTLTEGVTFFDVIYDNYFKHKPRQYPAESIPSVQTNLRGLARDQDVLVWFGHSSYFLQLDGKRILVDPVFSGNASPVPRTVKAFKGTDVYRVADLPDIDYLLITHDHYYHLDYQTLIGLKDKTAKVICGLGVGAHVEWWGYHSDQIIELDWNEQIALDSSFTLFVEPTRHFSGRGVSRNNTLWVSYVLQTARMKIYIGGDSGYDAHYAAIGTKNGPIDLAILDNGQYNKAWKLIHNHPEDVLKAAQDLQAKRVFPVHSSKFALSTHDWDEPLTKITELNKAYQIPLVTPRIGEVVNLNDSTQSFTAWWVGLN